MNLRVMLLSSFVSTIVYAAAPIELPAPGAGPAKPASVNRAGIPEPALACPAGTKQGGGQASLREASYCERVDARGMSVIHGPYVSLHTNGKVAVEGQYTDGLRTGLWRTYDATGAKVEEVTFVADAYQGTRTQWIGGRKSIEETYVTGRRQGDQRMWDAAGKVTVVHFVDDRPAQK